MKTVMTPKLTRNDGLILCYNSPRFKLIGFFLFLLLKKTERLLAERLNSHNKISFAIFSTSDVNTPLDGSTYHRWKLHCYGEILKMLLNNTFGLLSDHCSHLQTNGAGSSVGGCNCPGGCVFQNPK